MCTIRAHSDSHELSFDACNRHQSKLDCDITIHPVKEVSFGRKEMMPSAEETGKFIDAFVHGGPH